MSAERQPGDGPVTVKWVGNGNREKVFVSVQSQDSPKGVPEIIVMSEINARRVLGMLSMFLELPLSKESQKKIKL